MNELALFAGAGGGILGGKLLGWRTVCGVERDAYAAWVLAKRQNDGVLAPFPIWSDINTFDGRPWRGVVDVVSGGFPCQDISAAGKGAGIKGARSGLWGQMFRVIREVRPRFVFVENSPVLTSRGLGVVLGNLAEIGYDAEWDVLAASDVGANHGRKRIWILAVDRRSSESVADSLRDGAGEGPGELSKDFGSNSRGSRGRQGAQLSNCCKDVSHADSAGESQPKGFEREVGERIGDGGQPFALGKLSDSNAQHDDLCRHGAGEVFGVECGASELRCGEGNISDAGCVGRGSRGSGDGEDVGELAAAGDWWVVEPAVGRVANGVASRVDRIKAIGNGQVPLVAATAFRILKQRLEANYEY